MNPRTHQPLILLVDDYQDSRTMYAGFLAFSGYRVAEAENGFESIEKARALTPDLVLMDVSLPGIDGWEACRRLKADPETKDIPVVMLTAHSLLPGQLVEIERFLDAAEGQAGSVNLRF
jgi:two-component system cell cycle response regulator DivK